MRIVGGSLRGRRLTAPAGADTRPTTDRTRESLFNILTHQEWGCEALDDGRVLDGFCGTGALGLEALSRGAESVVMMDIGAAALNAARTNVATLGVQTRATVLRADVTRPPKAAQPCTLVFLDPPYGKGLAEKALSALAKAGWCGENCVAVVEETDTAPFYPDSSWVIIDQRDYGGTVLRFLRYTAPA